MGVSGFYQAGSVMGITLVCAATSSAKPRARGLPVEILGDFFGDTSASTFQADPALNLVLSKEKPGCYTGLKNDPRQTGECLSRDVHANSGWGNVLVSHR